MSGEDNMTDVQSSKQSTDSSKQKLNYFPTYKDEPKDNVVPADHHWCGFHGKNVKHTEEKCKKSADAKEMYHTGGIKKRSSKKGTNASLERALADLAHVAKKISNRRR